MSDTPEPPSRRRPPARRLALREDFLPATLPPEAIRLHRAVRHRMDQLDVAAEHGRDPWVTGELRAAAAGLRELLAEHLPEQETWCPSCRSHWGRHVRWPCHVWTTAHALLAVT